MTHTGKAFKAITANKAWVGQIALGALVNFVPILSWNNYGYFLNWAKELATGKDSPMPNYRVDGANFKAGFFTFLIGAVTAIVMSILSFVHVIPFLGYLIFIIAFLLCGMISNVMTIRYAITGEFGQAFKLGKVFSWFGADFKGLLDASYLSLLIILVIGIVVSVVYYLIVALISGLSLGVALNADLGGFLVSGGIFTVLLSIVYAYVMSFLMVLIMGISFRAVGSWAACQD